MVVGTGIIELFISESRSLKEKRGILNRLLRRTQNNFNISIAEVGANDHWKRAIIGFSVVGNDRRYINGKMDHIVNFLSDLRMAEIVSVKCEVMNFSPILPTDYEEGKYD